LIRFILMRMMNHRFLSARVAELADALDLGSSGVTYGGSSPPSRTNFNFNDLYK
jgi:hypothetical protein